MAGRSTDTEACRRPTAWRRWHKALGLVADRLSGLDTQAGELYQQMMR
jgi:hypothetical protein